MNKIKNMKTISFVIPVYNEEKRLKKAFNALEKGFSFAGIKLEKIIFVNDGSTDKTVLKIKAEKTILQKATKAKVEIVSYFRNMGKGYAVRQGMFASNSDYTLLFDVDMSTPLSEFGKFMPFIEKKIDVIVGTRKNGHSTVVKHQPLYRELLGKGFTLLSNTILNTWVTDFTCGFKAYSRYAKNEVFSRAFINRWGYDAENLFLARKLGFSIEEKAVKWTNDERTKVNLFRDLPQTLLDLFRIRFNHSYNLSLESINLLLPKRLNFKI